MKLEKRSLKVPRLPYLQPFPIFDNEGRVWAIFPLDYSQKLKKARKNAVFRGQDCLFCNLSRILTTRAFKGKKAVNFA